MFIDFAKAYLKAGDGGDGFASFRREKYVPMGGPNGGDGGSGGDIFFIADRNLNTLIDFKFQPRVEAKNGASGGTSNMTGKSGKPVKVRIPVGTVVKRTDSGQLIHDFTRDEEIVLMAKGGKGGLGNQHFATPSNQAPQKFTEGKPGEAFEVSLELKLIAEVGLVGFPNAGKSTFLSVVSQAKPKIANYPFTTLQPSLGVAKIEGDYALLIADIPGLIEGAHENKGLGIQFLRHIERTKVLLFILDMAGTDARSPLKDFEVLRHELSCYQVDLLEKEMLIAANKMDMPESAENLKGFYKKFPKFKKKVYPISAITREGLKPLLFELLKCVTKEK